MTRWARILTILGLLVAPGALSACGGVEGDDVGVWAAALTATSSAVPANPVPDDGTGGATVSVTVTVTTPATPSTDPRAASQDPMPVKPVGNSVTCVAGTPCTDPPQ